jgi:hypothetical protein
MNSGSRGFYGVSAWPAIRYNPGFAIAEGVVNVP